MTQNEMIRAAELLNEWAALIHESTTCEGVFDDEQPQADYEERRMLADKLMTYAVA